MAPIGIKGGKVKYLRQKSVDQHFSMKHPLPSQPAVSSVTADTPHGGGATTFGGTPPPSSAAPLGSASKKPEAEGSEPRKPAFRCQVCSFICFNKEGWDEHCKTPSHFQRMAASMSKKQGISSQNRDDLNVTDNLNGVEVESGSSNAFEITVTNNGTSDKWLKEYCLLRPEKEFAFTPPSLASPVVIQPGKQHLIQLSCSPHNYGILLGIVALKFDTCTITRNVKVVVKGEYDADLKPSAPYVKPPPIQKEDQLPIIPGVSPLGTSGVKWVKPLKKYDIPKDFANRIDAGDLSPFQQTLTPSNHAAWFDNLLYVEELQMHVDIRRYDMKGVTLKKEGQHLSLHVPGLAEKRPSVLYGDSIFVKETARATVEYEGKVHAVRQDTVCMQFYPEFHRKWINGAKYDVRFSFNRLPLRRCHQALELKVDSLRLFPKFQQEANELHPEPKSYFNSKVQQNAEQSQAVRAIVSGKHGKTPYVVFGPPGTGKSVTIIEAILQITTPNPKTKVLVCAPSNSAADLLCERLSEVILTKAKMLRLNAFQREYNSVPEKVKAYCTLDTDNRFSVPDVDTLRSYQVVVSTCMNAGVLYGIGVGERHFTHIFIDEAGQAEEPEALVAIAGLVSENTRVILAGDPKQLGPVLRSPIAIKYGLGLSLLERLLNAPLYGLVGATNKQLRDPRVITKLVNNYRSHPAILDLPSRLFYAKELVPKADQALRTSLCGWEDLPNPAFPLLFHGIQGEDVREANSPSWFNLAEVNQVIKYVKKLLEYRKSKLEQHQIGVISPYHKQVQKIRVVLEKEKLKDVKVGSVEEFQGQERRVIIISTVRSNKEHLAFDMEHNLGFLSNPKRFNVAITRAIALLIVIGNPAVLRCDEHWKKLLDYIAENKGCTGYIPPPVNDEDDVVSKLQQMGIHDMVRETQFGDDDKHSQMNKWV